MSTFDDLYKHALLATGSYSGGLYLLKTASSGDYYFLAMSPNKKGTWKGLQVDTVPGKRLPRKAVVKNQFGLDMWRRIDPKDAPSEVIERFAERAEEFTKQ